MNPFLTSLIIAGITTTAFGKESYTIDRVAFPEDMPPEIGAVEFAKNGDLYVALRRGDIIVAKPTEDPKKFKWHHFASGFHNPCGIHVVEPGSIVIGQMAELTAVKDTDNDGIADEYKSLSTDFGLSGNYHETMDISPDGKGGYYLAPGTASHNGPTFATPRGSYSKIGRHGRNFSSVQYRGWILHWTPEDGIKPVASGFRMHNGIELDPEGNLWCGDNQGDWRAASPVYHVTPGLFAAHPSSLVWDPDFSSFTDPLYLPRILLDDLWAKPAFHLPHSMIRSCAEPAFDTTGGNFGPFTGQMFVPDQSGKSIIRCMPEWIDGAYQGAATYFIKEGAGLDRGNNRTAFSQDGDTLYIGQTSRGWGAIAEGLQRIRFTGKIPFHIENCSLNTDGFTLKFTKPLQHGELKPEQIRITRYRYQYSFQYGSPEQDKHNVSISSLSRDPENLSIIHLKTEELVPNFIYRIELTGFESADGENYNGDPIIYTLNRLRRPENKNNATITFIGSDRIRVEINGDLFTEYHLSDFSKPILYPIINSQGIGMTRDWPVSKNGRNGEQHDHPHHKSLFIAHQAINGVDFWHERKNCGTVEHTKTLETRSGKDRALLRTFNLWKDSKGKVLCSDSRELKFSQECNTRIIDLELNMHASHGDLLFGEMKDGFVGIRTHPDLRLTPAPQQGVSKVFGNAENSSGDKGKDIWAKRANWVHYSGKTEGKPAGIAILSHPQNPRSPTWWHARDYGLIAVNPFGPKANGGQGALTISSGETLTLRYRFLFHTAETPDIDTLFEEYEKTPLPPRTAIAPIPKKMIEK